MTLSSPSWRTSRTSTESSTIASARAGGLPWRSATARNWERKSEVTFSLTPPSSGTGAMPAGPGVTGAAEPIVLVGDM